MSSGAVIHLDSFVDSGTVYLVYLLTYLFTCLRIEQFRFLA